MFYTLKKPELGLGIHKRDRSLGMMYSGLGIDNNSLVLSPAFKSIWHDIYSTIEMKLKEPLKHIYWLTESLYRAHVANQDRYYWKIRGDVQEMLERLDRLRLHQERKNLAPHQPYPVRGEGKRHEQNSLDHPQLL